MAGSCPQRRFTHEEEATCDSAGKYAAIVSYASDVGFAHNPVKRHKLGRFYPL